MKVEISIGEAVDKLSILELKMKKITNENKKIEIQKEINVLSECEEYKSKYYFYYSLLMYVNERIWDMTDVIKSITVDDSKFSYISNQIFEFNQKRFRIKNWFNLLTQSNIKEQKSYACSHCKIIVDNEDVFFDKLNEINYLSVEYDVLTFESPIISTIKDFLKIPTIVYDEEEIKLLNNQTTIYLTEFYIPTSVPVDVFSQKTITYIIGGMFGDFIQSLSIICEKFYETGRKGILYISDRREGFRCGLENTYNDIYSVIMKQNYIQDFKIYNSEPFEIDLTLWRDSNLLGKENWHTIYKNTYSDVDWGKRKWLKLAYDDKWKDKVVINTTSRRFPCNIDFKLLSDMYQDDLLFISSTKSEHQYFENKTQCYIGYYEFKNFLDLTTIINSCKLYVGSLSAPLAIAHSIHKERICGLQHCHTEDSEIPNGILSDDTHNLGLKRVFPNIRYSV
jgi:hypothetical protein